MCTTGNEEGKKQWTETVTMMVLEINRELKKMRFSGYYLSEIQSVVKIPLAPRTLRIPSTPHPVLIPERAYHLLWGFQERERRQITLSSYFRIWMPMAVFFSASPTANLTALLAPRYLLHRVRMQMPTEWEFCKMHQVRMFTSIEVSITSYFIYALIFCTGCLFWVVLQSYLIKKYIAEVFKRTEG